MKNVEARLASWSDEEAMQAYIDGNADGFEALYERHAGRVYALIRRHVRGEQEQNDLLQEVFLKLHRARYTYQRSRPVLPWLFSISKSVIFDHLRKVAPRNEDLSRRGETELQPATAAIIPVFSPTKETYKPEMETLSERQRQVLSLRYQQDLSFDEIGQHLSLNAACARQIASRAIRKLRKVFLDGSNG